MRCLDNDPFLVKACAYSVANYFLGLEAPQGPYKVLKDKNSLWGEGLSGGVGCTRWWRGIQGEALPSRG